MHPIGERAVLDVNHVRLVASRITAGNGTLEAVERGFGALEEAALDFRSRVGPSDAILQLISVQSVQG